MIICTRSSRCPSCPWFPFTGWDAEGIEDPWHEDGSSAWQGGLLLLAANPKDAALWPGQQRHGDRRRSGAVGQGPSPQAAARGRTPRRWKPPRQG